jgi:deoxyribonuclease-4
MTAVGFGAHTFGFVWQMDAEAALTALGEAGFRQVQLMASPPHFDPWCADTERTKRLRAIIEKYNLSVIALDLASNDINLASPADAARDFAVDSYCRAIDRGAELGARSICVGSGRRHPLLPDVNARLMDRYRAAFARVRDKAAACRLTFLLENHPQGLLAKADTIAQVLADEADDTTQVIYDVANAHAANETPGDGIAHLGHRIAIIHLSDAPPGEWRHDPIGSGTIDFAAIAEALRREAFAGPVVLEILSNAPLQDLKNGVAALSDRAFK